jgi:hypothetical protein
MKRLGLRELYLAIIVAGILALWEEWKGVYIDALFPVYWASVIRGILYVLTVVSVVVAIRLLIRGRGWRSFTAPAIAFAFIMQIGINRITARAWDKSPDFYSAWTGDIGGDGGLYLSFKQQGYLRAQKQDHWQVTYYTGSYFKKGDTLYLDIPFDFPLSRTAVIEGDSALQFLDSRAHFTFRNNMANLVNSPTP